MADQPLSRHCNCAWRPPLVQGGKAGLSVVGMCGCPIHGVKALRATLEHAAQALSGCMCSMADAELMEEITAVLDLERTQVDA